MVTRLSVKHGSAEAMVRKRAKAREKELVARTELLFLNYGQKLVECKGRAVVDQYGRESELLYKVYTI